MIEVPDLQGLEPEPGDAALCHTAGANWNEAEAYLAGQPGPGLELAAFLVDRSAALTGCCHGVFIVENLDTSGLAADDVSEFALIVAFPELRAATGAWPSPIALV